MENKIPFQQYRTLESALVDSGDQFCKEKVLKTLRSDEKYMKVVLEYFDGDYELALVFIEQNAEVNQIIDATGIVTYGRISEIVFLRPKEFNNAEIVEQKLIECRVSDIQIEITEESLSEQSVSESVFFRPYEEYLS